MKIWFVAERFEKDTCRYSSDPGACSGRCHCVAKQSRI